jgi:SRSO17 transposase
VSIRWAWRGNIQARSAGVDNCQIGTSLHLAGESGSACIGFDLYLPEQWAKDAARRRKAHVPEEVEFRRKWEIALGQLDAALAWGVRKHVVLADAAYGDCIEFREGLTNRGLDYVVGVSGTTVVWPQDSNPQKIQRLSPNKSTRPGRKYSDDAHPVLELRELAAQLKFSKVTWREGSAGWQASRFAAMRIRTAHGHSRGDAPGAEQWLLCEWPAKETQPTKFYLSSLASNTSIRTLVRFAKLRWRIERDYQEMKQEIGLDHFEGRSWRGFHHHVTLCAAAHAFLALRRALFPPEQDELDSADGPQSPSVYPPPSPRLLPSLPSTLASWRNFTRSVENVIE